MIDASILIPAYNAKAWIGAAIESALAQEGISVEVLVVDDGSNDGTVDVVRSFGSRVGLEIQSHAGGNAARNRLLRASRGRWLQYLDADDYLLPGKIRDQLHDAAGDVDLLYSPVWTEVWSNGQAGERVLHRIDPALDLPTQWILWQMPQTGGALFRREALERIDGWNEAMPCCQEHELYLRAIEAGLTFKYSPEAGAVYRLWSEQTVCRRDPAQVVRVRSGLIDAMIDWLSGQGKWTASHRRAASVQFFEMARTLARDDLPAAELYFADHRRRGLAQVSGPAAPWKYRAAFTLGGFGFAERLARFLR